MFSKGTLRDVGIDITLKNNPNHVLTPNDRDMVLDAHFGKISKEEFILWYKGLLKDRWQTRKDEFISLAKEGSNKDIKLLCFCPLNNGACIAYAASAFMNKLIEIINKS